MRRAGLVLIVLACMGMSGDRSPRLSFWHPPHQISEGERIDVQIRVPYGEHNDRVALDALEDGIAVSHSELPVNGPLLVFPKQTLPVGTMYLRASLYGEGPKPIATVTTPVRVRGKYESAEEQ